MINKILKTYFGYDSLKKEQEQIINSVLEKKDTIGLLPTGYGKSVCFQIPALILEGITLVISPLIALMADQVYNLKKKGINAEYINSLQDSYLQDIIYNKLINNKIKILYISAERLENKKFNEVIKKIKVSLIVIDEAHTLLWSEDFRYKLAHIPNFINSLGYDTYKLALTATATNNTIDTIIKLLNFNNPNIISINPDRENINYIIKRTNDKDNELINYIELHKDVCGIIYALTIRNCLHIYNLLNSLGYNVGYYVGTLDNDKKNKVLKEFLNNNIKIMVCTNAFGMGIDKPDIRYVIEYDIPQSIEDFLQQSGRASRDNKYAESILLFNVADINTIRYFIDNIENKEKSKRDIIRIKNDRYNKLDSIIKLCYTKECIHNYLCKYFGYEIDKKCNNMCCNCKKNRFIW